MSEVVDLARHIREKCPRLSLLGLMTIGFADVQPGTVSLLCVIFRSKSSARNFAVGHRMRRFRH